MAFADTVQAVVTDMNGQLDRHPKYVGTFRKVHAGMVTTAGKQAMCLFVLVFVFFPNQFH